MKVSSVPPTALSAGKRLEVKVLGGWATQVGISIMLNFL